MAGGSSNGNAERANGQILPSLCDGYWLPRVPLDSTVNALHICTVHVHGVRTTVTSKSRARARAHRQPHTRTASVPQRAAQKGLSRAVALGITHTHTHANAPPIRAYFVARCGLQSGAHAQGSLRTCDQHNDCSSANPRTSYHNCACSMQRSQTELPLMPSPTGHSATRRLLTLGDVCASSTFARDHLASSLVSKVGMQRVR